jgi:hypothetical protein
MPDETTAFPLPKPTVYEIVNGCLKAGQSEDAINATLGEIHPEMTRADLKKAYGDEAIRLMRSRA